MEHLSLLAKVRKLYPATTAAGQDLVMRAADLRLCRGLPLAATPHLLTAANRRFNSALEETARCAARETNEHNPENLMKFIAGFLAKVAMVSPQWHEVFPTIIDAMYRANFATPSLFEKAIEREIGIVPDAYIIAA
ncbi:hypothetical protein BXY66_2992 [Shimia isoporae]|uniref:Uncharacterized protein n=1 Tax=Shimia isoporae TaxID=647720 RepID=A0A4R1N1X2_9RHOB|nr:hypothetical protein [Shimia isoporae]TCL00351.1 hypothetical protein BXY66_2992 [Shimia isoporae]